MQTTTSPTGRRGGLGLAGVLVLTLPVAAVASANSSTAFPVDGWDTQTRRTLNYHIDIDMDCDPQDPNVFREHDVRTLQVDIDGGQVELVRTSSIESSSEHFGPYAFHADGSITLLPDDPSLPDDQKVPPMEAVLLLHVFDSVPRVIEGKTWAYQDPDASELTIDKLELQQTSVYDHLSTRYVGRSIQYDLDLESHLKLFDNLAIAVMVGLPGERTPEIEQIVADLAQDGNLFLYGTVTFELGDASTFGQTAGVDLTYVALPFSGGTRASIGSSVYRQHFTATLLP